MNAHVETSPVADEPALTVTAQLPAALAAGSAAAVVWWITNNGLEPVAANFYVRAAPALVQVIGSSRGRTQHGRYHGSATLLLEPRRPTRVHAMLEAPCGCGDVEVRVALVTSDDTVEATYVFPR